MVLCCVSSRGPVIRSVVAELAAPLLGLVLALPAAGPTDDPLDELARLIESTASVQSMVTTCAEESPTVSQHLLDAADAWWERNVVVRETMRGLAFNDDATVTQLVLGVFEHLKAELVAALKQDAGRDAEGFALRCERFLKDLDSGRLDYRTAGRSRGSGAQVR